MQNAGNYTIQPLSERAVVVQFDAGVNEETLAHVLSFSTSLSENSFDGLVEMVPGYCSLTVYYDPVLVINSELRGESAFDKVCRHLTALDIDYAKFQLSAITHTIPVCYDIKCGLDLHELAKTLKLDPDEIIYLHTKNVYTVYMVGFTPGFPYMGTLPKELECKRKNSPRKKIPAGSVALAGKQTGIYPFESPGGWQIIGRTPVDLFSVERTQPGLFKPGDKVKFDPISFQELEFLTRS